MEIFFDHKKICLGKRNFLSDLVVRFFPFFFPMYPSIALCLLKDNNLDLYLQILKGDFTRQNLNCTSENNPQKLSVKVYFGFFFPIAEKLTTNICAWIFQRSVLVMLTGVAFYIIGFQYHLWFPLLSQLFTWVYWSLHHSHLFESKYFFYYVQYT